MKPDKNNNLAIPDLVRSEYRYYYREYLDSLMTADEALEKISKNLENETGYVLDCEEIPTRYTDLKDKFQYLIYNRIFHSSTPLWLVNAWLGWGNNPQEASGEILIQTYKDLLEEEFNL
jgi:hypothetical protein